MRRCENSQWGTLTILSFIAGSPNKTFLKYSSMLWKASGASKEGFLLLEPLSPFSHLPYIVRSFIFALSGHLLVKEKKMWAKWVETGRLFSKWCFFYRHLCCLPSKDLNSNPGFLRVWLTKLRTELRTDWMCVFVLFSEQALCAFTNCWWAQVILVQISTGEFSFCGHHKYCLTIQKGLRKHA